MKFLFAGTSHENGGAEAHFVTLTQALAASGHTVEAVVHPDAPLAQALTGTAVRLHPGQFRNVFDLRGYRATTHWSAMDYLPLFGATPEKSRVCIDRNRISGGGVTAGIDFALTLAEILSDRRTAEAIQLTLEYNPAPPFQAGSPDTAPVEVLAFLKDRLGPSAQRRSDAVKRAAARLS